MSRDYKGTEHKRGKGPRSGSSLLAGILIGLVLGLGIALGVAWYINKMPSPFLNRAQPQKSEPQKVGSKTTAGYQVEQHSKLRGR